MDYARFLKPLEELEDCNICPRNCHTNRIRGANGYCKSDASFHISSICIHKGEEPAISGTKGICNIFFSHCNMQCIYCQNHQISKNIGGKKDIMQPEEVVRQIIAILDQGISHVGFVSPSHFLPHVRSIIKMIHSTGRRPVWVYNTNSYDKREGLRTLEGMIDVYLPDLKYMDSRLAAEYSDAPDYPGTASAALKEMFRQKGSSLIYDENGMARSGIIIRHLVLPGNTSNSIKVLDFIAENLSAKIHVSLMSQYFPAGNVADHPLLKRPVYSDEYQLVVKHLDDLGFNNGWIQESESRELYKPDFEKDHPFE